MQERRQLARWTISHKVFYKKEDNQEALVSQGKDINSRGICVYLSEEPAIGEDLSLTIHLADDAEPISAKGKVLWTKEFINDISKQFITGICFDKLKDEDKDKIFNYVYKNRHEELVKRWWQDLKA